MLSILSVLFACGDPTPVDTDAPVDDPLAYGIVDSCGTPGGDFGDFGDAAGPKLLVHDPAYLESNQGFAEFYGRLFGELELVAADQVTQEQLASSNLIIRGGADAIPLLGDLSAQLPVRFDDGSFVFGGYRWDNPGHGIAMIHPNPYNPERWLLLYAGNTQSGAEAMSTVPTGDKDFHLARGRMLQLEGKLCREGDAWGFFERRADDYRTSWDAHVDGLETLSTATHTFHYEAGSTFEGDADWATENQEQAYQGILELLDVDPLDHRIEWYVYETRATKEEVSGNGGNAHANNHAFEVHTLYGPEVIAWGAHEDVHVVATHRIGDTDYALMGEGLAVMTDGYWGGVTLDEWANAELDAGTMPTLDALIDDFWGEGGGSDQGYGAGGSFVDYLLDSLGIDAVKRLYVAADLRGALLQETGMASIAEVETAWHAWVRSR